MTTGQHKVHTMVRALPSGLALQAVGSRWFDKNLVHAIIGGKDRDCGSAVVLRLDRKHEPQRAFNPETCSGSCGKGKFLANSV